MASPRRDIVVIGGSAGALDPLKQIITDLPPDLPAAVIVVLHLAATSKSALAQILNRLGGMQVVAPKDADPILSGYVYVGVADHHLELTPDTFRLTRTPKVNGARPAIDVLFRTAAAAFGERVIGVILSGGLDDGTAGLTAIQAAGGVGIAQSLDDALVQSMPKNAIILAKPKHILRADEIGGMINQIVRGSAVEAVVPLEGEEFEMEAVGDGDAPGRLTGLTCPDCHGSIWVQNDGGEATFRCRIGHSYSPESFFEIQAENVENALWAGVRSLEEQAALADVMASRALKQGDREAHDRFERRREVSDANADTLRRLLLERSDA